MSWRRSMMIWATKVISASWSCWGLVSTGPPCTERPGTTSAAASGARWAMHQRSTSLPVICLPAIPLKSWQSTSRSLRLLVMGKKMFLFSPMFSRNSPRPYRRATRRQGQWPRYWFTVEWFQRYGVPQKIHSDQGRDCESKLVKSLCELSSIKKTLTIPYHPRGSEQCERFNRSLHDLLRTLSPEQKSKRPQYFPEFVQAYNNTTHTSTGFSPHFLLFGQEPQQPVDHLLGHTTTSAVGPIDWVRQHRLRL